VRVWAGGGIYEWSGLCEVEATRKNKENKNSESKDRYANTKCESKKNEQRLLYHCFCGSCKNDAM
jgi:hypothetical protein